ncbi:BglG family transcription antiterminator [Streptococcus sp. DD13]|uniref:BglG family transcription antiterminator n=1 Tax=Streptococcus sp. DD13 TaxID=1777881 RepID=UPI0007942F38|nr:HTH domain-containing protein [Streptococcus sp. DD13]KXT78661.1 Mannitol operon activator, BglG family [Streptococcus sp. DD13]
MLLTNREEQLIKAFLNMGKLSLKEMMNILQVSTRTVYRTLSDLTATLENEGISLVKEGRRYYLKGDLSLLEKENLDRSEGSSRRLIQLSYLLLSRTEPVTNEVLQDTLQVSNVTIIQDIAMIEDRLNEFGLTMSRTKGYLVQGDPGLKRRLLAILLTNAISISQFSSGQLEGFSVLEEEHVSICRECLKAGEGLLQDMDPKIQQFMTILLSLADNSLEIRQASNVSKRALDWSQILFTSLSEKSRQFYNLSEIVYMAEVMDEMVLKRQEIPLFQERFDSEFYYRVRQLIDSVSRFTKIDFMRDQILFTFLFHHLRLALAVPILFPVFSTDNVAYLAAQKNAYLHRLVSQLVKDIFPVYLQNEYEYAMISLHFASSLRRSPDIYPIRLLLVTDERPLMTSVLVSKIESVAPFVEEVRVVSSNQLDQEDIDSYDYCLATKPLSGYQLELISTFPSTNEMIELQEKLQDVQINRTVQRREDPLLKETFDLQRYLAASSLILQHFQLISLKNPSTFEETVAALVRQLPFVTDTDYLSQKLIDRFEVSPLAIPDTNLALLHSQSSKVETSHFLIVELNQVIEARSMNHSLEKVQRILVMLTKNEEEEEVRELMTAISQSILESKLYTEIYRAGNQEILYQLLNTIFNEKIKKLEN